MNNGILLRKLKDIDERGSKLSNARRPAFSYGKKKNVISSTKKLEIIRVAQENQHLFKRIQERSSFYNRNKWEKDYELAQYYKRNHCVYPCIDFTKTSPGRFFGRPSGKRNLAFFSHTGYVRKANYDRFKYNTTRTSKNEEDKAKENKEEGSQNEENQKEKELVKPLFQTKTYITELGECNIQFSVQTQK
ncbi:MAG: CFAP97 domain-containing protein [archaeon]|nr:CFAP97 domain-containing protein [archaeon]